MARRPTAGVPAALALAALLVAVPAAAQDNPAAVGTGTWPEPPNLDILGADHPPPRVPGVVAWDAESLAAGWQAGSLLGARAVGLTGEGIGEVVDLVLGPDNRVQALIVDVVGLTGVDGSRMAVPWDNVEIGPDMDAVKLRLTRDTIDVYATFDTDDSATLRTGQWRIRQMIGDRATLADGTGFGTVTDVVLDAEARIAAVVVDTGASDSGASDSGASDLAGGPYAIPFTGWEQAGDPATDRLVLPLNESDLARLEPLETDATGGR